MKKLYTTLLCCCLLLLGLTTSCYKDDSQLATRKITAVSIDTTGMSTLSVRQFEHLKITPDLDFGDLNPEDLSYEWQINFEPGDEFFDVISTEKNLDYEVRLPPNRVGKYHLVYYKVTDNATGLVYSTSWPLTVLNNIGEGLVIAVTPDGVHTDFSHIMSPEVTQDGTEVSVKYNVYSAINGQMLNGLVKQMRFTTIYGVDALMSITDQDIYRINTLDYTYEGKNDDLFFSAKSTYQPQALGAVVQGDVYVGEGQLTATYLGVSRKFGLPFDFSYQVPAELAYNGFSYYPLPVRFNFYDEQNEHFVYLPSIQFGDTNMHPVPANTEGVFDPMNVLNKENVAAGVSTTGDFRHLLKDKATGELALYVFDGGGDQYPSPIPPAPKSYYSLVGAPEIDQAKFFVFLVDQRVMYYATETKIYAMLYSTDTPSFEERYTVPSGETITTLQLYQQSGYPDKYSSDNIATNNKQLVMSTYNGSQGKVSLLPITNIGLGTVDEANIKTFDGFDKVVAIAPQK
ncbi:PKD-like family lipoprotein [Ochrovirga pacifica]|uniref:PKD-like family lipoprotein n=1 Tax=Ochrovirga pacifica TaxID=1042376 RepID=UPI0002559FD3|nr:PKD-like family lipoprotein [Ochrovirga pacifica]